MFPTPYPITKIIFDKTRNLVFVHKNCQMRTALVRLLIFHVFLIKKK